MDQPFVHQLMLKILEGPFLYTAIVIIGVGYFRNELKNIIKHRGITLTWGNKQFHIAELPERLNENFATVTDDIEELKTKVEQLEKQLAESNIPHQQPEEKLGIPEEDDAVRQRMLSALQDGQYTWRSIDRLASIGGVAPDKAQDLLLPMKNIVFGTAGKSGRMIARINTK
ncbi:hypothetical protein [Salidesulfovibrio onnuriiensis]|uniref:hypothetical protein n=1 Tax=Salidesulfovibrio onnuriiensis TaxID=2583823 RepID=UPI0011CBB29F|nr:hypothetical protein [Salidesulfovibrio onnuriiensis]